MRAAPCPKVSPLHAFEVHAVQLCSSIDDFTYYSWGTPTGCEIVSVCSLYFSHLDPHLQADAVLIDSFIVVLAAHEQVAAVLGPNVVIAVQHGCRCHPVVVEVLGPHLHNFDLMRQALHLRGVQVIGAWHTDLIFHQHAKAVCADAPDRCQRLDHATTSMPGGFKLSQVLVMTHRAMTLGAM